MNSNHYILLSFVHAIFCKQNATVNAQTKSRGWMSKQFTLILTCIALLTIIDGIKTLSVTPRVT